MSWRYAAHAANENFPSDAVSELEAAGHDIVWVRNAAPGSKDEDILAWAVREVAAAGAPLLLLPFAHRRDLLSDEIKLGNLKCCLVRWALPIVYAD